jgi:hypothetical protein
MLGSLSSLLDTVSTLILHQWEENSVNDIKKKIFQTRNRQKCKQIGVFS